MHTIHRGIQSNYQAVNDCRASAVLQPFITRASSGPYWARETAYHAPHHLMGLMQPINQQKSGCEVRQPPPSLPSVIHFELCFFFVSVQSQELDWGWDGLFIFFFFIFLREDAVLKNCNYSCKSRRRMWAARSRLIRNRSHLTLRASPNSSRGATRRAGQQCKHDITMSATQPRLDSR